MLYRPRPDAPRGQTFVVMLLIILPLLILALGVVYDLGNVAAGVTIAQNAADLAAQEAGKFVDVSYFAQGDWQEVRLEPRALLAAQAVAADMTGGAFRVRDVYVAEGRYVVVEGEVSIRTPFLSAFLGRRSVTRPVQGVAETAFGIEQEGGGE